jgi:predicted nucleic acid-binding protein
MVKNDIFLDTCGFYAALDRRDHFHTAAVRIIENSLKSGGRLILSDYIIIETINLAVVRRGHHVALRVLDFLNASRAYIRLPADDDTFDRAATYLRQHSDKGYTFTDCTSFVLMKAQRITKALTDDHHFIQAGFQALLKQT